MPTPPARTPKALVRVEVDFRSDGSLAVEVDTHDDYHVLHTFSRMEVEVLKRLVPGAVAHTTGKVDHIVLAFGAIREAFIPIHVKLAHRPKDG